MYRDMGNSFDDVKVKLEDVTALLYPQRQHQPEPAETNPGVAMLESHHGGIERLESNASSVINCRVRIAPWWN